MIKSRILSRFPHSVSLFLHAALHPSYNTAFFIQHCILHTTLRSSYNTAFFIQHCVLHTTLRSSYNTAFFIQHCVLHTALRPSYNTASFIQHCFFHATPISLALAPPFSYPQRTCTPTVVLPTLSRELPGSTRYVSYQTESHHHRAMSL